MNTRWLATLLTGALFATGCAREARSAPQHRHTGRPRTIVLELFTSQGCSSCPPADRLLSRLRREPFEGATIIPLAYHVDYWDHLGWSDPFSSPRWSQRQRAYAAALREKQVYTPQLIVNGAAQLVGSSEGAIRKAIELERDRADRGWVAIDRIERVGNDVRVDVRSRLDQQGPATRADVTVVLFENGITTAVSSGENARRTLVDDAIVRWEGRAGAIESNGTERIASVTIPFDAAWSTDRIGVAAFLQDPRSLAIYTATSRPLRQDAAN